MSVRLSIEWRDEERPWEEHDATVEWPSPPRVGEYIDLPVDGSLQAKRVTSVMWSLTGEAVVRVEYHPRP